MRYDPPRLRLKRRERVADPVEEPTPEPVLSDGDLATEQEHHGGVAGDERQLSVLGPTLVFKGELSAAEDLLIQGVVEGSIQHNERNLTIGPKGRVKADTRARNIIVQGEVTGDMVASESVVVEASAKVRGNIFAPRVGLKEGAQFKGSIDMDGQPTQAPKRKSSTPRQPKAKSKDELSDQQIDELLE